MTQWIAMIKKVEDARRSVELVYTGFGYHREETSF